MATLHYPIIVRRGQQGIIAEVKNTDTQPLVPNELCSYTMDSDTEDWICVKQTEHDSSTSRKTVCGIVQELILPGQKGLVMIMGTGYVKGADYYTQGIFKASNDEDGFAEAGTIGGGYLNIGQVLSVEGEIGEKVLYKVFMPGWRF